MDLVNKLIPIFCDIEVYDDFLRIKNNCQFLTRVTRYVRRALNFVDLRIIFRLVTLR